MRRSLERAVTLTKRANVAVGIRLHLDTKLLPVEFRLSDEGFRTIERCRLVWRETDLIGVEFIGPIDERSGYQVCRHSIRASCFNQTAITNR